MKTVVYRVEEHFRTSEFSITHGIYDNFEIAFEMLQNEARKNKRNSDLIIVKHTIWSKCKVIAKVDRAFARF